MALDAAGRDRQSGMKWSPPLTESALRSQLVADEIEKVSLAPSLTNLVESLPRQRRWDRAGLVNRTAYSDLLTITANTEYHSLALSCVAIIKNVPPPGSAGLISVSVSRYAPWLQVIIFVGLSAWFLEDLDLLFQKALIFYTYLIGTTFMLTAVGPARWGYTRLLYKNPRASSGSASTEKGSGLFALSILHGYMYFFRRLVERCANTFRPNELRRAIDQMNSERERGSSLVNRAEC